AKRRAAGKQRGKAGSRNPDPGSRRSPLPLTTSKNRRNCKICKIQRSHRAIPTLPRRRTIRANPSGERQQRDRIVLPWAKRVRERRPWIPSPHHSSPKGGGTNPEPIGNRPAIVILVEKPSQRAAGKRCQLNPGSREPEAGSRAGPAMAQHPFPPPTRI